MALNGRSKKARAGLPVRGRRPPNTPPRRPESLVVGIGASAGGIEALRKLFSALPNDLGVAYVVIVHLAPDHESELAAILARCTKMPVMEFKGNQSLTLKRDSVYVMSPAHKLEISDATIGATAFKEPPGRRIADRPVLSLAG